MKSDYKHLKKLYFRLLNGIKKRIPDSVVNGSLDKKH